MGRFDPFLRWTTLKNPFSTPELILGLTLPSTPMSSKAHKLTEDSQTRLKVSSVADAPRRAPRAAKTLGVIDQIILACKPGLRNRIALWAGLIGGGSIPLGSYLETHLELDLTTGWDLFNHVQTYAVIGGLIFSALTVYAWAKAAFTSGLKALGFVLFLEVIMTTSHILCLSLGILALLMVINAFATACTLNGRLSR